MKCLASYSTTRPLAITLMSQYPLFRVLHYNSLRFLAFTMCLPTFMLTVLSHRLSSWHNFLPLHSLVRVSCISLLHKELNRNDELCHHCMSNVPSLHFLLLVNIVSFDVLCNCVFEDPNLIKYLRVWGWKLVSLFSFFSLAPILSVSTVIQPTVCFSTAGNDAKVSIFSKVNFF